MAFPHLSWLDVEGIVTATVPAMNMSIPMTVAV
jgi:hypothetical protein